MESNKRRVISLLVDNQSGVLARVCLLYTSSLPAKRSWPMYAQTSCSRPWIRPRFPACRRTHRLDVYKRQSPPAAR